MCQKGIWFCFEGSLCRVLLEEKPEYKTLRQQENFKRELMNNYIQRHSSCLINQINHCKTSES